MQSFILLDKAEPEFKTIDALQSKEVRPQLIALLGVGTGLIDYRLSAGGATRLWNELLEIATNHEIASIMDAKKCLELLLTKSVCSQYNGQKASRISRVFSSNLPLYIVDDFDDCLREPVKLWNLVAESVGSTPEKKTVTFSMKVFDLAVFCCFGRYLVFEQEPPIAVDYHVRHMTELMGLVPAESNDDQVRHIWFEVARESSRKAGEQISPLRIDSLVWQSGRVLYDPQIKNHSKSRLYTLEDHLGQIGIDRPHRRKFMELLESRTF